MNRLIYAATAIGLAALASGCASTTPLISGKEAPEAKGAYYVVKRGDTLWKISKLHDVEVENIVRANRLADATKIDVGQRLYIPSAGKKQDYSKTFEAKKYDYMFSWPVAGKVSSHFGSKKGLVKNKGIDIEAREGSDVVAANSGVVNFIDENMKGLGKTIIIDHENGFSTVYAHNSEILVTAGQKVKRNQIIAKVGKTGRAPKPYLHFQIRKGHKPQNPFYYLP